MANLSEIKKDSNWGDTASTLNSNFQNVNVDLAKVKNSTINNKGYFSKPEKLNEAYPSESSRVGMLAYVGTASPYAIYQYTESGWTDTGETYTPEVNLGDYYSKSEVDRMTQQQDDKIVDLEEKLEAQKVKVDTELSESSENPIANSAVTKEIKELNDKIGKIDITPIEGAEALESLIVEDKTEAGVGEEGYLSRVEIPVKRNSGYIGRVGQITSSSLAYYSDFIPPQIRN